EAVWPGASFTCMAWQTLIEKLVKRLLRFEHVFASYPDNSSSRQSRAAGRPARRPQRLWRVRTEE
ncbi:hypothetical protein, partial [Sinorhizobium mexicanum]|uniref:hypothetical protein n=1 Tax=Sinorhizobium mexicanum TaxID=375549 RepID=UPI001AEB5114